MSTPKPPTIRLSDEGHWCVNYKSLHLIAKLTRLKLRLKGPGIDEERDFVQLRIHGERHLADVLTGTLYDIKGRHINNPFLRVQAPQKLKATQAEAVAA
jgi:hypothetical protein